MWITAIRIGLLPLPSVKKCGWGESFVKHTQHDLYKTPTVLINDILTSVMIDFGARIGSVRLQRFIKNSSPAPIYARRKPDA